MKYVEICNGGKIGVGRSISRHLLSSSSLLATDPLAFLDHLCEVSPPSCLLLQWEGDGDGSLNHICCLWQPFQFTFMGGLTAQCTILYGVVSLSLNSFKNDGLWPHASCSFPMASLQNGNIGLHKSSHIPSFILTSLAYRDLTFLLQGSQMSRKTSQGAAHFRKQSNSPLFISLRGRLQLH